MQVKVFNNHPWDICASGFLIQQAGGVISDLAGKQWILTSTGAIAAKNAVTTEATTFKQNRPEWWKLADSFHPL